MKTYVYGYDIKINDFEDEFRTIGKGHPNAVVVHERLTDDEVIYMVLKRICSASACRHTETLRERIEEKRELFTIKNVKLVKEYGKD